MFPRTTDRRLFQAIARGDCDGVIRLIETTGHAAVNVVSGLEDAGTVDYFPLTPFCYAIAHKKLDIALILLQHGANPNPHLVEPGLLSPWHCAFIKDCPDDANPIPFLEQHTHSTLRKNLFLTGELSGKPTAGENTTVTVYLLMLNPIFVWRKLSQFVRRALGQPNNTSSWRSTLVREILADNPLPDITVTYNRPIKNKSRQYIFTHAICDRHWDIVFMLLNNKNICSAKALLQQPFEIQTALTDESEHVARTVYTAINMLDCLKSLDTCAFQAVVWHVFLRYLREQVQTEKDIIRIKDGFIHLAKEANIKKETLTAILQEWDVFLASAQNFSLIMTSFSQQPLFIALPMGVTTSYLRNQNTWLTSLLDAFVNAFHDFATLLHIQAIQAEQHQAIVKLAKICYQTWRYAHPEFFITGCRMTPGDKRDIHRMFEHHLAATITDPLSLTPEQRKAICQRISQISKKRMTPMSIREAIAIGLENCTNTMPTAPFTGTSSLSNSSLAAVAAASPAESPNTAPSASLKR